MTSDRLFVIFPSCWVGGVVVFLGEDLGDMVGMLFERRVREKRERMIGEEFRCWFSIWGFFDWRSLKGVVVLGLIGGAKPEIGWDNVIYKSSTNASA